MTERLADGPAGIARAAGLLRAGELVAFGTETVYGLGADATNARAVASVFEAKGRPHFNPLICHYPAAEAAFANVAPSEAARRLAAAFWPGPLTMVLPRRATCPVALLTGAGLDTLAVRVPAHATALALLRATDRPVAAPSANRSGHVSPTTAAHVLDGLEGRIAAVLDSGPCPVGVESTVLDLAGPRPILLRPGGLTREAIEAVVGPIQRGRTPAAEPALRSPGMQVSHYAPALPVRLDATEATIRDALLAFGPPLPGAGAVFQLSAAADLTEAAANLFEGLRRLDADGERLGLAQIAVMRVPDTGLGLAINDRLQRAAAPRPAAHALTPER
ncbi:L-threonylcarbamoyladenylate synthase [Limobrevibacterium gyesilva]|uniref:Threonylcarbamoyl-AMP synthase n=1 Tax=Limobrevibacterium gyesilva TaxID=2991712 RepID=A0AA41YMD9_9PROT|nr:L-threonylcarbamoyladenylate synthase [Limobrevibacterium gyesilva]MCW3473153.1 L-threonylcarbamoyladenylate synthase [Limobrevibacterium gyesilva]